MAMERCPWCDTSFPAESLHEYVCPLNPAVDTESCSDCDGYGWKLLEGKVSKVWPCRRCGTLGAVRSAQQEESDAA